MQRLSFLFFFVSVCRFLSAMEPHCGPELRDQIRRSQETTRADAYGNSDRILTDYRERFDAGNGGFSARTSAIAQHGGVWMDFGARAAYPQRQFLQSAVAFHPRAKFVAISAEVKPETNIELQAAKRKYSCAFDPQVADLSQPGSIGEQFDVGTDYRGGFSYDPRPDHVLANYLNHMKDHGALYIGFREDLNFVLDPKTGSKIPLIKWLETIEGIQIQRLDSLGDFRITFKDRSKFKMPYSLIFRGWTNGLPPTRIYEQLKLANDDEL